MESKDKLFQKNNLEIIFRDAKFAPTFRKHPLFCVGEFEDTSPYIAYDDVINYRFIIRARQLGEFSQYDNNLRTVIKEYKSIEEIVDDGWKLD